MDEVINTRSLQKLLYALELQSPVAELVWSDGMSLAAKDHCHDMGASGAIGAAGSDGSSYIERLSRYGNLSTSNSTEVTIY
jgi:uncharacterized protein YkwD